MTSGLESSGMDGQLPDDVVARLDVTHADVRVVLRAGMTAAAMAELLRLLADRFDNGTISGG